MVEELPIVPRNFYVFVKCIQFFEYAIAVLLVAELR